MCPNINNLIVTLVVGNETHVVVCNYLINLFVSISNHFTFIVRYHNITKAK